MAGELGAASVNLQVLESVDGWRGAEVCDWLKRLESADHSLHAGRYCKAFEAEQVDGELLLARPAKRETSWPRSVQTVQCAVSQTPRVKQNQRRLYRARERALRAAWGLRSVPPPPFLRLPQFHAPSVS